MLSLEHPRFLLAALAAVLVSWVVMGRGIVLSRRARRRLGTPGRPTGLPGEGMTLLAESLRAVAVLLLALAAGAPRWAGGADARPVRRADVFIVLDVSTSMLADDVRPSRLEAARNAILDLSSRMVADRLGLICFGGGASEICPLTVDHDAFMRYAGRADPSLFPTGATGIRAGLMAALGAVDRTAESREGAGAAILIFSDGEFHGEEIADLSESARARGAPIHGFAIGTDRGTTLRLGTAGGEELKRDRQGDPVHTQRRLEQLDALAEETGGICVRLPESPLPGRDRLVGGLEWTDRSGVRPGRPIGSWVLWAALVLLGGSVLLRRVAA